MRAQHEEFEIGESYWRSLEFSEEFEICKKMTLKLFCEIGGGFFIWMGNCWKNKDKQQECFLTVWKLQLNQSRLDYTPIFFRHPYLFPSCLQK